MSEDHSWLDKIIVEQAAHYGMTPKQHAKFFSDVAKEQERIELEDQQKGRMTAHPRSVK